MPKIRLTITHDTDGYLCNQCDYKWAARAARTPRICPLCKSAKWDEAKKVGHLPWTQRRRVVEVKP